MNPLNRIDQNNVIRKTGFFAGEFCKRMSMNKCMRMIKVGVGGGGGGGGKPSLVKRLLRYVGSLEP